MRFETTSPSLNMNSVGMPRTPNWAGRSGFSSMLTLAILMLASYSVGELLERGADLLAGAAPFRPEIHQNRHVRAQDFVLEGLVRHLDVAIVASM